MLSILISIVVSVALTVGLTHSGAKQGTAVFWGTVGFIASFYLQGWFVRRRIKKVQDRLQEIMAEGQKRMNRKIQQFQSKPNGNIKLIQRQIEADQKALLKEALEFTKNLEPFKKWSLLMGRQIDTMRMQFLYQLKEFEQVDELLKKRSLFRGPLLMEPMPVAMKMARLYKNKQVEEAEKTFKRHIKWFRGDRGTLLYGLMSWIHVKSGQPEKALQLLIKGKEATGDETLALNWERLANNKVKQFSNSGLGEEWYGLFLENPPAPKQQRMRPPRKGRRF